MPSRRPVRAQEIPPDPAALIASMRAFGYSLPTAIADLIDNSITAGATEIAVTTHWEGDASWISIVDDGSGMSEQGLVEAMRLGSRSPREQRSPADLGRFGLGLKTAAFSQATSLTVATATEAGGSIAVRRWDLDHVTRLRSWSLLLDPDETGASVIRELDGRRATIVLLQGLDRLSGDADADDASAADHFLRHADAVVRHLAMVFHRFLSDSGLVITVNGTPVEAWDPFLVGARGGQRLSAEPAELDGRAIVIRPYVLPHFSNLTTEQHARAAGPRGWNQQQGFYVYRARRLLVAGGWLGLPIQPEEHYKLARIAIELDNSMDLEWQIDVRKATARIPRQLVPTFRRVAETTRSRASQVYRYRGKNLARSTGTADHGFVWRARIQNDQVSYRIDRDHPVVRRAREAAGPARTPVDALLRLVEETVPVAAIVMDARERPDSARGPFDGRHQEVLTMLRETFSALTEAGARPAAALQMLAGTEPFVDHPDIVAALAEDIDG